MTASPEHDVEPDLCHEVGGWCIIILTVALIACAVTALVRAALEVVL